MRLPTVSFSQRLDILVRSLGQLGLEPMVLYAWYQLALRTGVLRRATASPQTDASAEKWHRSMDTELLAVPRREELLEVLGDRLPVLISAADEIVDDRVRCFGAPPVPLALDPPGPLLHWTSYELGEAPVESGDIKLIWEPARFGWALFLAQAYQISGDDRYAQAFWRHTTVFLEANPPYLGPNWVSAQEVALRLICLSFSAQVFAQSARFTPDRRERLALAIGEHAARIPATLIYARSQNNNHLLAEAAGLFTAGRILPAHPQSDRWLDAGRLWFNRALEAQIAPDGTYIQQSANYHRLMLQLALWMHCIDFPFSSAAVRRLAAATDWLHGLVEPGSGAVPNLGPNDGAYILPLTSCSFQDFRPILQAASLAFRDGPLFADGPWNDMSLWLANKTNELSAAGVSAAREKAPSPEGSILLSRTPHILRSPGHASWAYLRAVRFTGRPGHADQLHLDLWAQGINIAVDAGTYSYNDPPPWDNALARTAVHNTLTVQGADQMKRAGRFLWLDWAQARILEARAAADGSNERILAEQDGYRGFGVLHRREVIAGAGGRWTITDRLLPAGGIRPRPRQESLPGFTVRLHWLLPDWRWHVLENRDGSAALEVLSPVGPIQLNLRPGAAGDSGKPALQIMRAGQLICGQGAADPTWGWSSPTYRVKAPALSVGFILVGNPPLALISEWILPAG